LVRGRKLSRIETMKVVRGEKINDCKIKKPALDTEGYKICPEALYQ
jgi:hypothetical protein